MPPIEELSRAYLARPDNAELNRASSAWKSPFLKGLEELLAPVRVVILATAKSPPSPGYERFFVESGVDPIPARMIARVIVRRGRRIAAESRRLNAVAAATRFLAKRGRRTSAIARRAEILLAAWNETSIIESIFDVNALGSETNFIEALRGATKGEDVARRCVTEIAAILVPHLSNPRGRKVSAASAAHECFLEIVGEVTEPRAYTWSGYQLDFVDEATEATRREFADPDFGPQPARRRIVAQQCAELAPSRRQATG